MEKGDIITRDLSLDADEFVKTINDYYDLEQNGVRVEPNINLLIEGHKYRVKLKPTLLHYFDKLYEDAQMSRNSR